MLTVFNEHILLFAIFLLLNVIDWITGRAKAKAQNKLNSDTGCKGMQKKVMVWVTIAISFLASVFFMELGHVLNADLNFMQYIGYIVLAGYSINEFNSITENLVICGVKIPKTFINGLAVASKIIESKSEDD